MQMWEGHLSCYKTEDIRRRVLQHCLACIAALLHRCIAARCIVARCIAALLHRCIAARCIVARCTQTAVRRRRSSVPVALFGATTLQRTAEAEVL